MMDLNRSASAGIPEDPDEHDILISERDSRLIIDLSGSGGCTQEGAREPSVEDATLETAVTLVGMATEAVKMSRKPLGTPPGQTGLALDLSTQQQRPHVVRSVKEEHLPRKKRRIDDVMPDSPDDKNCDKENGPPSSKVARKEAPSTGKSKSEDGKPEQPKQENNLVNSFVAKAMKIWYDEDLEASRNRDEPKDLTCKETMPKTDSFVSSYPPGYPRPDDGHSNAESNSYPFLKLKAMLRKKYANSLNEFSGGDDSSPAGQASPPLPLRESSPSSASELYDAHHSSIIETKNGEKLYRCNVCFKAFTFSTNLTRHQRNIHGKPHRRRTKDFSTDKLSERRDSTGSDLSRPDTPDSRAMSDYSAIDNASERSTPLSHLARPVCSQCDMEFDNDELLELHNCDQFDRSSDSHLNSSGHFTEPISFIQELTSKIERASSHPLKSRCEDLMREEYRRASFGGLPRFEPPSGVDRRLSMEAGLVPPKQMPFENEKRFQIVLSENHNRESSPVPPLERDEPQVPSPASVGPETKEDGDTWRFKCIECRLAFPTSKHLSKHLKVVHKVSIKDDPHNKSMENGEGREHQCRECGKTFSQQAYLRRHMRNIHMKPQQLEMLKLPPQAPAPSNLNIVRNAGSLLIPGMTTIFCHLCGQTFSHPVHHYMHMAMTHGIMLQPDNDPRLGDPRLADLRLGDPRMTLPGEKGPLPHPAEPREADTAETRPLMGSLPQPLLPGGVVHIMPTQYQLPKEDQAGGKQEKRPAPLEGRRYSDNGLDLTKDSRAKEARRDSMKENPSNLGEFILRKVAQEVKSPLNQNSPKDLSKKSSYKAEDYGKENQENNNIYGLQNIQNVQGLNLNRQGPVKGSPSPSSFNGERLMFPSHSDGKRHICGLCGASFTFQTNLTRHQRKLHGKPFVRRPSASQVFKQEAAS